MIVYLASAIDRNKNVSMLYTIIHAQFEANWPADSPLVMFAPKDAFMVQEPLSPEDAEYLISLNEMALHTADIMLLCYSEETESWGAPQEVLLAHRWKVPIVVLSSTKFSNLPLYLRARISPERVFKDITELINNIAEIGRKQNGNENTEI